MSLIIFGWCCMSLAVGITIGCLGTVAMGDYHAPGRHRA